MKALWVKKNITNKQTPYFSAIPAYRTLYASDSGSIIAFRIPDGEIPDTVEVCTFNESEELERKRIQNLGSGL